MGEVYRATDTSLRRLVAIKVLPEIVASDGDRMARFQREAEVLASLNHPNIATIYGLERSQHLIALVMELVEGPTLAERIAKGPIPIDEALQIAAQIAEGLAAAHEQRVIHRDLKPANIKLRPDGTVKVLDFGLAKTLETTPAVSGSVTHSPTITMAMTQPGFILGTAAYMAPEQARGEVVDQRADIWAFGCVLYEMLTGRMAFGASTPTETVAKILEGHPDLSALPASTPPAIRRLVRRCLERQMRTRVQHIGDALADIVDVRAGESFLTSGPTLPTAAPRARAVIWGAASLGLIALGAAGAWFLFSRAGSAPTTMAPIRFDVQRVQGDPLGPAPRNFALSPDGTRLAYATASSLRLRAMGGEDVPLSAVGEQPFFSPDGQWLAFFSNEGLQRVRLGGGTSEPITPPSGTERAMGGTWGADDTIVMSLGGRLLRVSAKGGPLERIAEPDSSRGEVRYAWPEFLPDGRSVLFTILGEGGTADAKVAVLDLATRQVTSVLQGGHAARYLRTGHLLYASQGRLHAVAFDPSRLQVRGVPVTLEGMNIAATAGGFNASFVVSESGTLVYLTPIGPRISVLTWVDRNGRQEAVPTPPLEYVYARISPDGTRVALDVGGGGKNRDIWVGNLASGVVTRITDGPTEDVMPAWSLDGARVFFASDREGGTFKVFSVAADGAGTARKEFAGASNFMPLSMPTPDRLIAFASGEGTRGGDLAIVPLGGGATAPRVIAIDQQQTNAQVSPDGRWIAYQSHESGTEEVYVRSYPDVERRREQISIDGGIQPLWGSAASHELFYWDLKGTLKAVPVTTGDDFRARAFAHYSRRGECGAPVCGEFLDIRGVTGRRTVSDVQACRGQRRAGSVQSGRQLVRGTETSRTCQLTDSLSRLTRVRTPLSRIASIVAVVSMSSVATPIHGQESATPLPSSACASLQGMSIPATALRLPTSGAEVQTAVTVSATTKDNPNGDFCKVTGIVKPNNPTSPNLEFEVNLPLAWNRRVLQMGGGGYNGSLVTGLGGFTLQPANVDNPLKQGFVTVGTDGGHKSPPGFDGSFGMDDEALRNFGKESVKKGHDAALAVIKRAYGRGPERWYFIGGSQGGHEALDAAARYPDDYDGVVAHYPAYNVTLLHLGSLNAGRAVYEGGGAAWLNPARTKLITDAVYAKCDDLDGVKDGTIANVKACNNAFDVKTLRCAPGSPKPSGEGGNGTDGGDTCLSDAQLAAVAKITSDYRPGFAVAGMDVFPRWALLEGALFRERSNWGQVPQPSNPLSGKEPLLYTAGDQTAKFIISRNPKLDTMTFDPKQYQSRIATVASIMDVTDVSLDRFRAKGGKIILTHGTADDFITPHNTEALLPASGEAVRSGGRRQLRPLLHDSRLRPRLRSVQREDRQPHGAASLGREGSGALGSDGDRRQPECESRASVV